MEIKSSKDIKKDEKIHVAIWGPSGSGKTKMIETLPGKTLVGNADKGLLTLKGSENIDYVNLDKFEDVIEFMKYLKSGNCDYDNVVLDSISTIGDKLYEYLEKKGLKGFDLWREYGKFIKGIIGTLRDSTDFHTVSIFELVRREDPSGLTVNMVGLQGSMASKVPYFYDCFLATRVKHGREGSVYKLQTRHADGFECKIRGGENIETYVEQDLGKLFELIKG